MADPSTSVVAPTKIVQPSVLVSGASFAGLATAYWMKKLGYRVTIVELASGLRRGGTPVDIEGETIEILSRMGMMEAVRAKTLPPRDFEFKDENDGTLGGLKASSSDDLSARRYEIHRDDLLDILFEAVEGSVDMKFGRSLTQIEDGPTGVAVTFSDGSQSEYALVFGCDGNRSNTRTSCSETLTHRLTSWAATFICEWCRTLAFFRQTGRRFSASQVSQPC